MHALEPVAKARTRRSLPRSLTPSRPRPSLQLPSSRVYKLRTPRFRVSPPPAFSTLFLRASSPNVYSRPWGTQQSQWGPNSRGEWPGEPRKVGRGGGALGPTPGSGDAEAGI